MIYYPEEFKKKVLELYPENEIFLKMLENNDENLGERLRVAYLETITFEDVEKANTLAQLRRRIEKLKTKPKFELYKEWCNIFVNQNNIFH